MEVSKFVFKAPDSTGTSEVLVGPPSTMDVDQLEYSALIADQLIAWASAVKKEVNDRVLRGDKIPG